MQLENIEYLKDEVITSINTSMQFACKNPNPNVKGINLHMPKMKFTENKQNLYP